MITRYLLLYYTVLTFKKFIVKYRNLSHTKYWGERILCPLVQKLESHVPPETQSLITAVTLFLVEW